MKKIVSMAVLFCSVVFAQRLEEIPIATVGDITITQKEFLARYELAPGLQRRKNQTEANKAEFLLSLIAEKLLILKSRQEGWDNDASLNEHLRDVERLLVRDELYRREVSQKITVTEEELKTGLQRAQNELKIYFLYTATKEGVDFLYSQIKKGKKLEEFIFDHDSQVEFSGPDSAIARWGDGDERMEKAVYALAVNETSEPIYLDDGWYIAKVMGKTMTVISGEKERSVLKEKVESTIRKRKERALMSIFMERELRSTNAEVNAQTLKSIIIHLWKDAQAGNQRGKDSVTYFVGQSSLEYLRAVMADSIKKTLVVFPHTTWTVEQTIEKIAESNLATVNPTLNKIRFDIEQRLRDIIDQEFLTEAGYRRGLHQSNAVRNDLKVWRDAYGAQHVRGRIQDSIMVTQRDIDEIKKIFQNDTSIVNNDSLAREKVFEIKLNNFTDRFTARIANTTTITFFEQNFRNMKVTVTPSMVFRYLGFGGRMFAVPFVIPQTGWVNYWEQKEVVLP